MKTTRIPVDNEFALIDHADWCATFTYTFTDGSTITIRPCRRNWHIHGEDTPWRYAFIYCACPVGVRRKLTLHRLITGANGTLKVDHINGNTLDNRRCNLRLATNAENLRNMRVRGGTSRYKGVYHRPDGLWRSQIMHSYKRMNLGNYETEEAAAKVYDRMAIELFGPYARLNFPAPQPLTR